jgi:hypothetical protein
MMLPLQSIEAHRSSEKASRKINGRSNGPEREEQLHHHSSRAQDCEQRRELLIEDGKIFPATILENGHSHLEFPAERECL